MRMSRKIIFLAILIVSLFLTGIAYGEGVILYSKSYFGGDFITLTEDTPDIKGKYGEYGSSIKIPDGWKIQLFEGKDYTGEDRTDTGPTEIGWFGWGFQTPKGSAKVWGPSLISAKANPDSKASTSSSSSDISGTYTLVVDERFNCDCTIVIKKNGSGYTGTFTAHNCGGGNDSLADISFDGKNIKFKRLCANPQYYVGVYSPDTGEMSGTFSYANDKTPWKWSGEKA